LSAIHDLIAQVSEPRLRTRLAAEWASASQNKKFGLVFEDHLPELMPLYGAKPRRGDLVCRREGTLKEVWRVVRVDDGVAHCVKPKSQARPSAPTTGTTEPVYMAVNELVVVREFGEPIFPALIPVDAVANGSADSPWHALIEADNYHALQLLDYLYAGQVDCIYIDPPYNTGARDWKYNNDYVDGNDGWRHSKWLAFMERRLKLAKRLLKPDTGVLIVTIDEHEVHHLGMLLERNFPEAHRQLVTIVINQKGVAQGRLSRAEEYAVYCFNPGVVLAAHHDDLLSPDRSDSKRFQKPRWEWLLRGGTNSKREDRPGLFFPIEVDPDSRKILSIGDPLPLDIQPDLTSISDRRIAWPLRTDGSLGNWRVSPPTLRSLLAKGYVKLGGFDEARGTWTILYLGQKAQKQILAGTIEIVRRDSVTGEVEVLYTEAQQRSIKTVWHRSTHDAGNYGSSLLRGILGEGGKFSFPKSLYATYDAVAAVVRDRPQALIVDFFAGSGTTLNAVNLLNAADGGQRRCILVTNNEASSDLISNDLQQGPSRRSGVAWKADQTQERAHADEPNPVPARDVAAGVHGQLRHGRAVRRGGQAGALAAGLRVPALQQCGALRGGPGRPQAVSMQWLPPPDLADRGQPVRQHQAAAENVVPGDLPAQPGQDGTVGAGAQAASGRELPDGVADAPEDHARDGRAGGPAPARRHGAA
jgi:adenine-specific DNA-methyltransferase